MKAIVYDDKEMALEGYDLVSLELEPITIDTTSWYDSIPKTEVISTEITFTGRYNDEIKLDPTTMKKIARFNKIKELEKLNEEIKRAKEDKKAEMRKFARYKKKITSLQEFNAEFMKTNYETVDEYIEAQNDEDTYLW